MKFSIDDVSSKIVKQDDRYIVKDNTELTNLIVSSTQLYPGKSTSGHSHTGQEEVYIFIRGQGEMDLGDKKFPVFAGDLILIEDGVFHRVHNTGETDLYFICVFDGRRNH